MIDLILFPSGFFSIKKVDEDLQGEYDAVKMPGLYDTIFFGYDKWVSEGILILNETPSVKRKAIMRGWMLKPEQYEKLYYALSEQNIELMTSPADYRQMHIFPSEYFLFFKSFFS